MNYCGGPVLILILLMLHGTHQLDAVQLFVELSHCRAFCQLAHFPEAQPQSALGSCKAYYSAVYFQRMQLYALTELIIRGNLSGFRRKDYEPVIALFGFFPRVKHLECRLACGGVSKQVVHVLGKDDSFGRLLDGLLAEDAADNRFGKASSGASENGSVLVKDAVEKGRFT